MQDYMMSAGRLLAAAAINFPVNKRNSYARRSSHSLHCFHGQKIASGLFDGVSRSARPRGAVLDRCSARVRFRAVFGHRRIPGRRARSFQERERIRRRELCRHRGQRTLRSKTRLAEDQKGSGTNRREYRMRRQFVEPYS